MTRKPGKKNPGKKGNKGGRKSARRGKKGNKGKGKKKGKDSEVELIDSKGINSVSDSTEAPGQSSVTSIPSPGGLEPKAGEEATTMVITDEVMAAAVAEETSWRTIWKLESNTVGCYVDNLRKKEDKYKSMKRMEWREEKGKLVMEQLRLKQKCMADKFDIK